VAEALERRSWRQHPLLKRLPLLLLLLIGLLLWRSQGEERQLVYVLPPEREDIERVEVQLRDDKGELIKREAWFFERGRAPTEVVQKLKVREGTYQAEVFLMQDGEARRMKVPMNVSGEISSVRLR